MLPPMGVVTCTLQRLRDCRIDIARIWDYNPGFPLPDAATAALHTSFKCHAAPGTGPRVAFPVRNTVEPYILETIYSRDQMSSS